PNKHKTRRIASSECSEPAAPCNGNHTSERKLRMQEKTLLFSTSVTQQSLAHRLFDEFTEASRDFRRNPKAYLISAIRGEGFGGYRRKMLLEYGLAIALLLYSGGFLVMLTLQTIRANQANSNESNFVDIWLHLPPTARPPDDKAPEGDEDKSHGGNG